MVVSQLTLLFRDKEANLKESFEKPEKTNTEHKKESSATADRVEKTNPRKLNFFGDDSRIGSSSFKMPLHYPRYKKQDYEKMSEEQIDRVLIEYGMPVFGDLGRKKEFAMGAFLWDDHVVGLQEPSEDPSSSSASKSDDLSEKPKTGLMTDLKEMMRNLFRACPNEHFIHH